MNSQEAPTVNHHPNFSEHGYKILEQLGQNFTGGRITYKAIDNNQQPVVIKQFKFAQSESDWSSYRDIQQEIEVLKSLNHPNIPYYINSFETNTGFCLVQEYKHAISSNQCRKFTLAEINKIAVSMLEILVYLQQQNPPIIHRDIKPENILIDLGDTAENLQVYLIDFGFARSNNQELAYSSVIKGTLGFMPPEQIFNRQLTRASDLYSLGVTLICLIANVNSTEIEKLLDENFNFNCKQIEGKVNKSFLSWVTKMVKPKLNNRWETAEIAFKALEQITICPDKLQINFNFKHFLLEKQVNSYAIFIGCIGLTFLFSWIISLFNYDMQNATDLLAIERKTKISYLNDQGVSMAEKEEYKEALKLFNQVIILDPNDEISWYNKAVALRGLKKYEESNIALHELQKISPDWQNSWEKEGTALSEMNQEDKQLIDMNEALALNPNDSKLWTDTGLFLMKSNRYEEAKSYFEKALEVNPNDSYARKCLLAIKRQLNE
jgi:serine/threonine protein kinase